MSQEAGTFQADLIRPETTAEGRATEEGRGRAASGQCNLKQKFLVTARPLHLLHHLQLLIAHDQTQEVRSVLTGRAAQA